MRFRTLRLEGRRTRSAFTLIELLVVIAIISLLISILLPSLVEAKKLAVRTKCLSRVRHLHVATMMYASEFDGWLPPRYGVSTAPHVLVKGGYDLDESFVQKFIGDMRDEYMFCPSKLMDARNPDSPGYETKHCTYQYFSFEGDDPGWLVDDPQPMVKTTDRNDGSLWTCMTIDVQGWGTYLAHDVPWQQRQPDGQNAVGLDGGARWTPFGGLEAAFQNSGNIFYWTEF